MFQFDKFFWSSKKFDFRQVFEKFGKLSKINKRFWMIRFDKFFYGQAKNAISVKSLKMFVKSYLNIQ